MLDRLGQAALLATHIAQVLVHHGRRSDRQGVRPEPLRIAPDSDLLPGEGRQDRHDERGDTGHGERDGSAVLAALPHAPARQDPATRQHHPGEAREIAVTVGADLGAVLKDAGHRQERDHIAEPDGAQGRPTTPQEDCQRGDGGDEESTDEVRRAQRHRRGLQRVKRREPERDHHLPRIEGEPVEADGEAIEDPEAGHRQKARPAASGDERDGDDRSARQDERDLLGPSPSRPRTPPTCRVTPETAERIYVQHDEDDGERHRDGFGEEG